MGAPSFIEKKLMSWHNFIFSDKPGIRTRRHLIFWLLWWIYFAATYYYYIQVGLQKIDFGNLSSILILKTFFLIIVHILSCYAFIYFLLPRYLIKGKYLSLAAGIGLLIIFLVGAGYFVHAELFPFIDHTFNYNETRANSTLWWTSINSVLLTAPKIIAAAAAIKLVKRWYLKQKEKEKVEKEKLITDLQLLKAQVRPDLLFSSLDNIYTYAKSKSPEAQKLLLQFSDLLSYLLYECDDAKVPLEKELNMMKEYMTMEKIRFANNLEMEVDIKGRIGNKTIAPLLLLPFIENSFRQCNSLAEQSWINLELCIEDNILTMKLMNGVDIDKTEPATLSDEIINVQKRLQLLYPANHELKMYTEQEICMTFLKINLTEKFDLAMSSITFNNHESNTLYATN
jgi:two-component system LytT family sensor kinase